MSLLSVKNLTIKYQNQIVINRLNFDLASEDFLCIVGANGSGKSTLLKTILGLIQPSTGKISFSKEITPTQLGYMPQESKINPNSPATVTEVINSGFLSRKISKKEQATKLADLIKQLNLTKIAKNSFRELSGGQRQRILLARALAATDKLLILDEPSNNLDKESRKILNSLLQKLNNAGLTIILVTHDLDHDNIMGNKILNLSSGFFGSTEEYYRRLHDR